MMRFKREIENGKTEFQSDNINILLAQGTVDLNIDEKSYNPMTSHELAAWEWTILLWDISIIE